MLVVISETNFVPTSLYILRSTFPTIHLAQRDGKIFVVVLHSVGCFRHLLYEVKIVMCVYVCKRHYARRESVFVLGSKQTQQSPRALSQ